MLTPRGEGECPFGSREKGEGRNGEGRREKGEGRVPVLETEVNMHF